MNYRHFYTSEKTKNNNNYQKLSNASSNQKKKKNKLVTINAGNIRSNQSH
jgi:hypothetical protein